MTVSNRMRWTHESNRDGGNLARAGYVGSTPTGSTSVTILNTKK